MSLLLKGIVRRCSNHRLIKKQFLMGYVLAIISAILASLTHSISKPVLESTEVNIEINPIVLAVLVYMIAGLFFTPRKKSDEKLKNIGSKNLMLLTLIGIAEVSAMSVSFFGITETTAVNAAIFINAEIIFSILIATLIFREKLQKKEIFPFGMIILGVIIIPIFHDYHNNGEIFTNLVAGDLLIILGGLFFALSNTIAKYVSSNMDARRITQISSFAAAGFGLMLIFGFSLPLEFDISQIPAIVTIGILDVGFATLFFVIALRLIGAVKTVLLFSTATVFGMIFANLILNEVITIFNVISIIIVFLGLYWLRNKFAEDSQEIKI